jgi:hypothetical protein
MAVGVIHRLEAVEIDVEQADPVPVAPRRSQRLTEPIAHHRAVGQLGEHVVLGHVGDARLAGPALGDVAGHPCSSSTPLAGLRQQVLRTSTHTPSPCLLGRRNSSVRNTGVPGERDRKVSTPCG